MTTFSSIPLSWVPDEYPNHVYASNLSCVQITDLMTCEEQRNGLRSPDGSGSGVANENEVDGTSASNNENDEIPLIIPNISPTLDDDGDDGSGQENSEDGSDGTNSEEGNDRASNANDNNNNDDDLEISAPSVLPFP